jgi:recombination protein RecA
MRAVQRAGLKLSMGKYLVRPASSKIPSGSSMNMELTRRDLSGRLVEISGYGPSALLTMAGRLVLEAQLEGEAVAWITTMESSFYPPDMEKAGVDLGAMAVVRCPEVRCAAKAVDRLARSGAFGLLILDLGGVMDLPLPLQTRLAGLARTYDIALVFLTEKSEEAPSVSSLVSIRLMAERSSLDGVLFLCKAYALKDKMRGPGWSKEVACHGPPGLC